MANTGNPALSSVEAGRLILLDGHRWSTLFVLLSLDLAWPFYSRMRLQVPDGFIPAVRNVILRHASLQRKQPLLPSHFVPETLEAVARTFDESTCVRLIRWGRTVFTYKRSEHPTLQRWSDLLTEVAGDERRWHTLRLPPDIGEAARRRFAADAAPAAEKWGEEPFLEEPLSDWDVCLYALRGFDDDDVGADPKSPARWIGDTMRTARRLELWSWLLARLGADEQSALLAAASDFAGDEPLRHPRLIGIDDE